MDDRVYYELIKVYYAILLLQTIRYEIWVEYIVIP